jgi:hypothetical protein
MRAKQRSAKWWEKHIEAFRASGMTQREYCQLNSMKPRALQYHLTQMRRKESNISHSLEKRSEWVPVSVVDSEPERISPGGVRLQINRIIIEAERGFDSAHLTSILRTVGAIC